MTAPPFAPIKALFFEHRGWWRGRLLLLLVLTLPSLAQARDTLYLLDLSQTMAQKCPNSGPSLYELARSWISEDAGKAERGDRAGVITYGLGNRVTIGFSAAQRLSLAKLPARPGGKSQADSLDAALEATRAYLIGHRGKEPTRVVVTGGGEGSAVSPRLREQISMLRAEGTDISYLAVGPLAPASMPLLINLFPKVDRLPCPATRRTAGKGPSIERLRELAAQLSGIDRALLDEETDFITGFGMDRLTAYEIVAAACEELRVQTPEREDLTTLRKLADYLASAPPLPPAKKTLRGRKGGKGEQQVQVQEVFFGTDRKRLRRRDPAEMFTGDRAPKGRITYGRCEVTIPIHAHQRGGLETPLLSLEFLEDPLKHVILRKANVLDKRGFFRLIRQRLAAERGRPPQGGDILVFIHGFNVSFENAARRTAQVAYDLGFNGVPMFFSWPSEGALYAYVSDREDVEWSVPHLADFLRDLTTSAGAQRVHLIAHSMGHEGLLRALSQLALESGKRKKALFENVIMAAPDFDAEIFADQFAPRMGFIAKHWTLYASDKDVALNISSRLRFAERLGLPLTVVPDVVTVDASGVEVTPWSVPEFHSYFATKQLVIADIVSVLQGIKPSQRKLKKAHQGRLPYWRLSGIR